MDTALPVPPGAVVLEPSEAARWLWTCKKFQHECMLQGLGEPPVLGIEPLDRAVIDHARWMLETWQAAMPEHLDAVAAWSEAYFGRRSWQGE